METAGKTGIELKVKKIEIALRANPGRKIAKVNDSNFPKAAVSVLLRPDNPGGQLVTLLIKRNARDGDPWSGHMAFPGGRSATSDKDIFETAERETLEETLIDLNECKILGTLDEIKASSFNICVTPFVALAPEKTLVRIDEREIETFVWIPLSFFINKKNAMPYEVERLGATVQVPSYRYLGQHVVWGMTFRIIQDFISKIGTFEIPTV